ncbi:MAG: hypothetical protein WC006_06475 [Bacilli bacterium]|nr:hypothetical protein [Bacilli bacterium]
MEFVKAYDKLNVTVKLILTIFFDPIIGGIYRILKGRIIWGIIWLFAGLFIVGWVIDVVTVILHNKYTFLV